MTEREKRDLARRLAQGSKVFDFEKALQFVEYSPAKAEEMIRNREKVQRTKKEFARLRERRRQAFIEDFGYAPPRAG